VTARTRSWIQAAEMSFLQRVAGLSLRNMVRSSAIRRELSVELMLLHIERSPLGYPLVPSLWRFFRRVQLGRGPGADL